MRTRLYISILTLTCLILIVETRFYVELLNIKAASNVSSVAEIFPTQSDKLRFNISGIFKKPLQNLTVSTTFIEKFLLFSLLTQVETKLMLKINDKYRSIFHLQNIEWCLVMQNVNSLKNRFAKAVFNDIKKAMPALFSPCPFKGVIKLINIEPPDKFLSIVPQGTYLISQKIVDKVQKVKISAEFQYLCNH